ncbi:MAG TPA: cytochrome c oxidase subunit 3 [Gemmatimonadales bacterium]|nr:cytochrome c oxidase subunit 3 [Gemmatimonadales bacterium]
MTAVPLDALPRAPDARRATRDVGWWGMALLCATEASLFASLIGSYFYLALVPANAHWPPAGIADPALGLPLLMTALLLASSGAFWWGERGIARGDARRLRLGLALAALLGIGFLLLQLHEYGDKLRHFGPTTHAYGALFYTITGFHGAHVAFGVLMLLYTGLRALRGHFTAARHQGVTTVGLYWHFVDGVWLVIVTSLYVSPHFY